MQQSSQNILFYDTDWNGHHAEFILHLLHYQPSNHQNYIFLLHPNLQPLLKKEGFTSNIYYLTPQDLALLDSYTHPQLRGIQERKILLPFIKKHHISHLFLLYMEYYVFLIFILKFLKKGLHISGIQFMPYYWFPSHSLKAKLRKHWHKFKTQLALINQNVSSIFILNDKTAPKAINKALNRHTYQYLPDPVNMISSATDFKNLLKKNMPPPYRLLVFGHISPKKNLDAILNALALLEKPLQQKIQLLIVGQVDKTYQTHLNIILKKSTTSLKVDIKTIQRYVSKEEMGYIFKNINCLLVPYLDGFKSSGQIGLAAQFQKLVIAPNSGLMSRLVQDYGLGKCVNPSEAYDIANAIKELILQKFQLSPSYQGAEYINERQPNAFAHTIYQAISDIPPS